MPTLDERSSADYARQIIESLLPDETTRLRCLETFADFIDRANREGPTKWGVTLYPNAVRLNVGHVVFLDILKNSVALGLFAGALSEAELKEVGRLANWMERKVPSPTGDYYPYIKGSRFISFPTAHLAQVIQLTENATSALLAEAIRGAKVQLHLESRKAHSPGVLNYLREVLHRNIPDPTFLTRRDGVTMDDVEDLLKEAFTRFKEDPVNDFVVKLRRQRSAQLRELFKDPGAVSLDVFNREFWAGETKSLLRGADIGKELMRFEEFTPERISELAAALESGELELHGNYTWGSGTRIYGAPLKGEVDKEANVRKALEILNDSGLAPIEKARQIQKIPGFGPNITTGALMMFHPMEFAIYNEISKGVLGKLGMEVHDLENFERSASETKELLGADDFLEFDWFLYSINQKRYLDLAQFDSDGPAWLEGVRRVLEEAGEPLHEEEIASRAVKLGARAKGKSHGREAARVLAGHPDLFERVGAGVYRLKKDAEPPLPFSVWIFQAKPEFYALSAEVAKKREGDEDSWSVTSNAKEMRPGDVVLLWQAEKNPGVYAFGELTGEPYVHTHEGGTPSWVKGSEGGGPAEETRVNFRYTGILEQPLLKSVLKDHPILKDLLVIRRPAGTNFRVTTAQWQSLQELLNPEHDRVDEYVEPTFNAVRDALRQKGLRIEDSTLRRYHLSLKTRGFVVLSGLSGTGKTWLAEAYAQSVSAEHVIVPVAPNWTTNEDLLGYLNPIDNGYRHTSFSRFLIRCAEEYDRAVAAGRTPHPYHLILDEMNLARVEQYFAKFLSGMEVRQRQGSAVIELSPHDEVRLTPNLFFVGTVNVDETTHGFADKVYDRAQMIELQAPREEIARHIAATPFADDLLAVWDAVNRVAPFAFRVLNEMMAYVEEAERLGVPWEVALDEQVLQKVLPKCKGADPRVGDALTWLVGDPVTEKFPLSRRKAQEMLDGYRQSGFASYF